MLKASHNNLPPPKTLGSAFFPENPGFLNPMMTNSATVCTKGVTL